MKNKRNLAIILIIFSTFLNTIAQILYKFGANNSKFNLIELITNYSIILGILIYGISATIFIVSLKYGELSVLYPIFATGYIWVTISSIYFFNEQFNLLKILGIIIIIIGISIISFNTKNQTPQYIEEI